MKKTAYVAGQCLAFFLFTYLFIGCKKSDLFTEPDFKLNVITTTPDANELASRYDINVTASFNTALDTSRFSISLCLTRNDSLVNGVVTQVENMISFTPEVELLPSASYVAAISVVEKEKSESPVYTYQWKFTTKVADEFVMTQRSTSTTDFVRDGTRSMQIGNYLYSFGGWHVPEESFNDVYRSSGDLSQWEKLPDAPWHGRHEHGIATIDSFTYILGGDYLQSSFDVWRTKDGENWTLVSQDILENRILYACASHKGYMYIVGGGGFNDVWRSRDGKDWEQVATDVSFLKGECFAGSLASFHGKLWMICGGTNGYGQGYIRKEVWSSVDGKIWNREKDFGGSKRYYTDVMVWDNKLWVIGGYNHEEGNIKSIWYMKPDGAWKEFETPADYIGRHATGLAVYNNQLVITCGNYNNDCWVIQKVK